MATVPDFDPLASLGGWTFLTSSSLLLPSLSDPTLESLDGLGFGLGFFSVWAHFLAFWVGFLAFDLVLEAAFLVLHVRQR